MPKRATTGTSLVQLIDLATPLLQEAELRCPRTGPGRPPEYEDWKIGVMIMSSVLKKKKSKSAQYNYIAGNAGTFCKALDLERLPARSTFFDRYLRVWPLMQQAITLQGRLALREGIANAQTTAADKSMVPARGPYWNRKDRKRNFVPKWMHGLDRDADWGYSDYHGWVWGYSFEVVVSVPPRGRKSPAAVFPLLASVDCASANEHKTFPPKIELLPRSTRIVLVDGGYDGNDEAERVEFNPRTGRPTGRQYVCPVRGGEAGRTVHRGRRERMRQRRTRMAAFLRTRRGRALYSRRRETVEPFNEWFKNMFELSDHGWHRGLDNNRTQILTAVFCYQLLVRYHRKCGGRDSRIQCILDRL
jgi:hypothetical protein